MGINRLDRLNVNLGVEANLPWGIETRLTGFYTRMYNLQRSSSDIVEGPNALEVSVTAMTDDDGVALPPSDYVLGISRSQHYYINDSGIFVELPCGRAARNTTQSFRRTITP